jgi:hypothetical protein
MTITRRVRVAATAAVALAAAVVPLGLAAPAAADPPGLVVEAETSNPTSSNKATKADCPAGTVVTGGGAYLTAPNSPLGLASIYRMEPAFDGTGFWVGTQEVAPIAGDWRHTAIAVCAPEPPGYEIVSQIGGNQVQYVTTPTCGAGRSVIGVGGRINSGTGQVTLEDVTPSFDLKTVTVRGVEIPGSTDDTWSVTAYAVCANTPAGLERMSLSTLSNSDSHNSVSKTCPAGKALYGVGIAVNAGNGNVLLSGANITNEVTAHAWADEITGGYGGNWTVTTYGICGS